MTFIVKMRQILQRVKNLFRRSRKEPMDIVYDGWKTSSNHIPNPIEISAETDIPAFLCKHITVLDNTIYIHSKSEKNSCPIGSWIQWKQETEKPEQYDCWIAVSKK